MGNNRPGTGSAQHGRRNTLDTDNPYLSARFKIWVAGILFFLVFFHFVVICLYPTYEIIPKELILGIALALIAYLWGQEVRDRSHLKALNENLIQAQKNLEEAEIATIASLIQTEEANDVMARGHSERVARFSIALAESQGFIDERKEMIRRAAALHDLGKLAIPDRILQKPGKLNEEEWKAIHEHPQMAVEILAPLKFLFQEKKIILHHHERIDGKGYPDGLRGEEIPLESRMIAVADTFDAMNSSRVYREACSKDHILGELKKVSGSQLDVALVKNFFKIIQENPNFWEKM